MQDQNTIESTLENLTRNAPDILTRKKFCELTGGVFSVKYLANMDSLGEGITPRLRIGGKVCYPKGAAIDFIRQRAEQF